VNVVGLVLACSAVSVLAGCGGADEAARESTLTSQSPGPVIDAEQAPSPAEVRYLRSLLDDINNRGPHDALRDVLAAAPGTLPPAELLRLEDDLLTLAHQLDADIERLVIEPADGLVPGVPIHVELRDGTAVLVRVDCRSGCRVVGVDP
jgi:hypothetical protein